MIEEKPKILFVDDEPNLILALKRILRSKRNEWEMYFVSSGAAALEIMEKNSFDVIVSDMRMPEMTGAELFEKVLYKYPNTIRIILSGFSEQELLLKTIRPTHKFLSKPCEPEILILTIEKSLKLQKVLDNDNIQRLVMQIQGLPSLPTIYTELITKLKDPDVSIKNLANTIQKDVSMTAQILKIVNSSFFGINNSISNTEQAISLLGLNMVKTLVLSIEIFSMFNINEKSRSLIDMLWKQSEVTALFAKSIAANISRDSYFIENSFLAGFLHEIGILILLDKMPKEYLQILNYAKKEKIPLWRAEQNVIKCTHSEIGAFLLRTWGFSEIITEAVLLHHHENIIDDSEVGIPSILHFANSQARHQLYPEQDIVISTLDNYISDGDTFNKPFDEWKLICEKVYNNGEK